MPPPPDGGLCALPGRLMHQPLSAGGASFHSARSLELTAQEEQDTSAASKGTQQINWCDNSCYSSAAPTPRTGPDSPRTAAAAAPAKHASLIPTLPLHEALGLQLSSELKPFAQCLSPTDEAAAAAAAAAAAGRKQPMGLLYSPGRRSPSKPSVLLSEDETAAALRGLISPQNSHPPPGRTDTTQSSPGSGASRRRSTSNSCSISIGRSAGSSFRSASSSISTDASPSCRTAAVAAAAAAQLGNSSPRYGKSTSSSRARTAISGRKASEGKLADRAAREFDNSRSRSRSFGDMYDPGLSPSSYAVLSPGRTARAAATTTASASAHAQVRSVYSSISETPAAQTQLLVPSASLSTAAGTAATRRQSIKSAAVGYRASADAGVAAAAAAAPRGMRSSLTRSSGGVNQARRLSSSIGSFNGRVWKDPGSCNGATPGRIVTLPVTTSSFGGRKLLASSNGGFSSSNGRTAGAAKAQGYAAVAEQRRSVAAAGSKVGTLTRRHPAAAEAYHTAVDVPTAPAPKAAAAAAAAAAAPASGGDIMAALAAVAAMASAMAAVSAAAAAAAAVREFEGTDATQTAATAQTTEVTNFTEITEMKTDKLPLPEAAQVQEGPTKEVALCSEITAAAGAVCTLQEEQATSADNTAPAAPAAAAAATTALAAGSERLQLIDESAAAAAAAAAAKAAAASGYVSPRDAEKSVVMELEPSALPFLISKAILRRPVELIITEDAVYCASNPQLLSKTAPTAGSRSPRSAKPTESTLSLVNSSRRSLAAAASMPKALQQVCSTAAEAPGCTGALLKRSVSDLSGLHTVERLEAAYEALRVVSNEYTDRAGAALKAAAAVQRAEAAARFEAAASALKAHSLLAWGRAVKLYGHSAAMLAALDAAGRFSAAAAQLKQLSSEGASRARQLFKHAAAFIIASQSAKHFMAAFEALKSSAAALPAPTNTEGASSSNGSSGPGAPSPAVVRMQSARASAKLLWSKAASRSSKQLSASTKVLSQSASAAGRTLHNRASKLSKTAKEKIAQGARSLSKAAAKRLSKLRRRTESSKLALRLLKQTGSSSSSSSNTPQPTALQASLELAAEVEAAADAVFAAEDLQSLAAAVGAAGPIECKVAAAVETADAGAEGIKAGC